MVISCLPLLLTSVYFSFLLGFGEARDFLSTVSIKRNRNYKNLTPNKHPFIRIVEASSSMYKMSHPRVRSLANAENTVFLDDITIYFQGLPTSFDKNTRQAFEKSTERYLTESVLAGTSDFKFSSKITDQGRGYVICDFEIELQGKAAPSISAAEVMFRDLISYSFNDAYSNKSYIKLLKDSSFNFRNIKAVSLVAKWTSEPTRSPKPTAIMTDSPTLVPASSLLEFYVDGLFLEFYGIAELNQLDRYLLKIVTEKFLQGAIIPELGADFQKVTVKLTVSEDYFFNKMKVGLEVTGSVRADRSMTSLVLNNNAVKNILVGTFHLKHDDYLSKLIVLRKGLYNFKTSILSDAPSAFPSESTGRPTLHKPSQTPSSFVAAPTNYPSNNFSYEPSENPSTVPSNLPSEETSFIPSKISSAEPNFRPSSTPSSPTNNPSLSPVLSPSTVPTNELTFTPSNKPSFFPNNIPSTLPSNLPSILPSKSNRPNNNPSQLPSEYPTLVPTPCIDDNTYTSRYALKCSDYSQKPCSEMHNNDFSLEEVEELMMRCKKTCNNCQLSRNPSMWPSTTDTVILSQVRSEVHEPSTEPRGSQTERCSNDISFKDKYGFNCEFYRHADCSQLEKQGFSKIDMDILVSACPDSCNTDCPHDTITSFDDNGLCIDNPNFRDSRYGLSCTQHDGITCEKLVRIGFSEKIVKEIVAQCPYSCKKCPGMSNVGNNTFIGSRAINEDGITSDSPNFILILGSCIAGSIIIAFLLFVSIFYRKIKNTGNHGHTSPTKSQVSKQYSYYSKGDDGDPSNFTSSSFRPVSESESTENNSFVELTVGDMDEINIHSGSRVPNNSGVFDIARVASVLPEGHDWVPVTSSFDCSSECDIQEIILMSQPAEGSPSRSRSSKSKMDSNMFGPATTMAVGLGSLQRFSHKPPKTNPNSSMSSRLSNSIPSGFKMVDDDSSELKGIDEDTDLSELDFERDESPPNSISSLSSYSLA